MPRLDGRERGGVDAHLPLARSLLPRGNCAARPPARPRPDINEAQRLNQISALVMRGASALEAAAIPRLVAAVSLKWSLGFSLYSLHATHTLSFVIQD